MNDQVGFWTMNELSDADGSPVDLGLRARAARVIPGGLWGHQNAARLPAAYPQFFERGEGCRLWDVDGRDYIDFLGGWGPVVLGHHDPEVEAAADAQRRLLDCGNGPTPRLVELAELMVELLPDADWAMFQKNGTDATTACLTIARAATGRRKVLVAHHAYHGAAPWCTPRPAGVLAEDRAHLVAYTYNDVPSLEEAGDAAGGDLAAVLVSAFKHDVGQSHELPSPAFATAARELCDRAGAALIIDEVRAGFRLDLRGSWAPLGVRPDLAAWSKAIANGHPLAAVTGCEALREAASRVFITGSFWTSGVAMAAALATLTKLRREDGIEHMRRMGERLRAGLAQQARSHGLDLRQSGPPQMPLLLFGDDPDHQKGWHFCTAALRLGVYLHATHTMFVSVCHQEADIDRALEVTDAALGEVAERFG